MPAEWSVAQLEYTIVDGAPDKVVAARYKVTEKDPDGEWVETGRVEFAPNHPINNVPYDNLQEATVIGHIKAAIGGQQVSAIEVRAAQRLAEKVNPTAGAGTPPWAGQESQPGTPGNSRNPNQ